MQETSIWPGVQGISDVCTADEKARHDGFVELSTTIALNTVGEKMLEKFLLGKVKNADGIFVNGTTIKVIAKKLNGKKMTTAQLKTMGNHAINAIETWANRQGEGDRRLMTSHHNERRIISAMATDSTTRFGEADDDM